MYLIYIYLRHVFYCKNTNRNTRIRLYIHKLCFMYANLWLIDKTDLTSPKENDWIVIKKGVHSLSLAITISRRMKVKKWSLNPLSNHKITHPSSAIAGGQYMHWGVSSFVSYSSVRGESSLCHHPSLLWILCVCRWCVYVSRHLSIVQSASSFIHLQQAS